MSLTLRQYIDGVRGGTLNSTTVLDDYLKRAKEDRLFSFVRLHEDYAHNHSAEFSARSLAGAPIGIKDIILTKGEITSCSSQMLKDFVSPYSATCFEHLEKNGGVMIGKTNMDEFAMGSSTENSAFGPTINPYGKDRVPGGTSGGSAVAIAQDLCIAALGTDTGGSVRQPASFCNIVGLKPTYGTISRYGVQSMASSFDQVGVMTKTVEDAEILLRAVAGQDNHDAQSNEKANQRKEDFEAVGSRKNKQSASFIDITKLKIAIPEEALGEGLDPRVKAIFDKKVEALREAGILVETISLPILAQAISIYYTLMPAEVSTNLARFDGMRFGLQDNTLEHDSLMNYHTHVRSQGFGDEAKRRILLGTFVLSSANYEGYYLKAQQARLQFKKELSKIFERYDIILTPTAPNLPWKIGAKVNDPLSMYLEDLYTVPANIAGLPGMSVPAGMAEDNGEMLPVGIHLMGKRRKEADLFALGSFLESTNKN